MAVRVSDIYSRPTRIKPCCKIYSISLVIVNLTLCVELIDYKIVIPSYTIFEPQRVEWNLPPSYHKNILWGGINEYGLS